MIPPSVEIVHEKGSEEVPYSNERSTQQLVMMDLDLLCKPKILIAMRAQLGLVAWICYAYELPNY